MKITELTAVTLGKKIKAKEITVAEAVSAVLEQIEAVEGDVHAYVTLKDKEKVLKKAEEIQAKIDAGELDGPLAGVPVAVKDNMYRGSFNYLQFENPFKLQTDLHSGGSQKSGKSRSGNHRKDQHG